MTLGTLFDISAVAMSETLATSIADRLSKELVIALVGPVGSGVSTSAKFISELLEQDFGYDVREVIKPSDIIRAEAHRVRVGTIPSHPLSTYVHEMQNAGNALRERFGGDYLAQKAIEQIVTYRKQKTGTGPSDVSMPGRRAYIIDSIKNTEELELLRSVYRESLCLIGIFAPDKIREQRLLNNGAERTEVQKILDRDRGEAATFGQMTQKVFVLSDFFICNDSKKEELHRRIRRYLEIIFDTNIHTPTRAESAMYKASAAGANSACMSRQVGAAVVSASGELISVGWNDVPKFGGALYVEDDQQKWDAKKEKYTRRRSSLL